MHAYSPGAASFCVVSAFTVLLQSAVLSEPLYAQTSVSPKPTCDSALEKLGRGAHRYQLRDDRCEGVFSRQDSELGSFYPITIARIPFAASDTASHVFLEWNANLAGNLDILAVATRRNTFYQMNTRRHGRAGHYRWPLDLAHAEGFTPPQFGLLAWTVDVGVDGERITYVPLTIREHRRTPVGKPTAVFAATAPLKNVAASLGIVGDDGLVSEWLFQNQLIGDGEYSRGERIELELPSFQESRLLKVELTGVTRHRPPLSVSTPFYIRGVSH